MQHNKGKQGEQLLLLLLMLNMLTNEGKSWNRNVDRVSPCMHKCLCVGVCVCRGRGLASVAAGASAEGWGLCKSKYSYSMQNATKGKQDGGCSAAEPGERMTNRQRAGWGREGSGRYELGTVRRCLSNKQQTVVFGQQQQYRGCTAQTCCCCFPRSSSCCSFSCCCSSESLEPEPLMMSGI